MSNTLPLALSYAAMYAVQSKGPEIIGLLWGTEAREAAVAQNVDDVQPDADVGVLCGGYDAAHFDVTSNILHAAGMVAAVYAAAQFIVGLVRSVGGDQQHTKQYTIGTTLQWFLWIWAIYYLPAWVGHLWYQKDIPAVFTYGTTIRGWAAGEYCAFCDLLSGGIVNKSEELVPTVIMTLAFIFGMHQVTTTPHLEKAKAL